MDKTNNNIVEDGSVCYVPQTVQKLLDYILSLSLSSENQQWLAEHLYEAAKDRNAEAKPYTIEELTSRIDEAEVQIANGNISAHEDVMKRAYERLM